MSSQLTLPRRSRRLATIIPASHWISIGYSQVQATAMEKLQNDMKKYCDGGEDNEFELRGVPGNVLSYHDMMLPHWKKLFKALRPNVNTIKIFGINLPNPILNIMFPALHLINLEFMVLLDNHLGSEGLPRLSAFVKENSSLKRLVIGDPITTNYVADSFADAVKGHPCLERVGFIKCGLNDSNILSKILQGCKGIRELRLGYEKLGLESITIMADFIRSNYPTENICMSHCQITDDEAIVLAAALTENTNLKDMNLTFNDVSCEGEKALLKAMYDPTSMDSIVDSNHSCMAYTYDMEKSSIVAQRPHLETAVLCINGDEDISIKQKIRKKVILALCGVDGGLFDLSHLNDLPLQLMPRVLELIQKHTTRRRVDNTPLQLEKDALSRLFHTLRGWELPLLFENLRNPSVNGAAGKRKKRKTHR